jgi:hypothetical protein
MRLRHILLLVCAGLFMTLPLILGGLPKIADDSATHAIWYSQFAAQLWAGEPYPRWLQGLNGGLGGPVFFYYGPVPYYWTSILHPFFTGDTHGWYQLGVSTSAALIASGVCAYLWLKKIVTADAALLAAVLYMAMPYHLAIDLYTRGALAEFWAFVWMPLVLYFVLLLKQHPLRALVGLALSYALLVMTHLPTTLIFSGVPVFYAFFVVEGPRRMRTLGLTVCGMALGVGLSAIYLFPAMTMQDFVSLQKMRTGFLSYENWFLLASVKLPGQGSTLEDFAARRNVILSCTSFIMAGMALCAYAFNRRNANVKLRRESLFWFVVALLSLFMMTPLSKPVWRMIPTLQAIQFPYRFSIVLTLAVTLLFAAWACTVKQLYSERNGKILLMTVSLALIAVSVLAASWRAWRAFPLTNHNQEILSEVDQKVEVSRGTSEYHPRWSQWGAPLLLLMDQHHRNPVRAKLDGGTGSVSVSRWESREILLQVDSPGEDMLTVNQFYYPGWTARLAGEQDRLNLEPSTPDGLLRLSVPSGRHAIDLRLERSPAEFLGHIVSAFSALIVMLLLYAGRKEIAEKRG